MKFVITFNDIITIASFAVCIIAFIVLIIAAIISNFKSKRK